MTGQKTHLYIVRHAQTEGNVKNTFGGNPQLTNEGRERTRELSGRLPLGDISKVYSSDYDRAVETAQIIIENLEHLNEVVQNKNLRERHYGHLENQPILQAHKDIHNKALAEDHDLMWNVQLTTNDETNRQAVDRFKRGLLYIVEANLGQHILIISHGNVMRSFLVDLGFATFNELRGGTLMNNGVVCLECKGNNFNIINVEGVSPRR